MNVARLNFSHGDYTFHGRVIRTIRRLERLLDTPVAILQDLPGPKIRIGPVGGDRVRLQTRRQFVLTTRKILGSELAVSVNFPGLTRAVKKGDRILVGDGEIELEATQVGKHEVKCKIIVGGILGSHKGIHFPHGSLNIRALTNRDKKDLAFGIEQKVDMIALSFVRTSGDILYARRELQTRGSTIPLIAKMEKHEAVDHIDAILEIVDGIMVARGDLGLEIAQERIPTVQKMMIRKANHLGKPVITATQMLRSMVWNPRPTRAEVTDIANAVLDGTDALMLSEETAAGEYPVEAVRIMAQVAVETEKILEPRQRFTGLQRTVPEAISVGAISLAHDLQRQSFFDPDILRQHGAPDRPLPPAAAHHRHQSQYADRKDVVLSLGRVSAAGKRLQKHRRDDARGAKESGGFRHRKTSRLGGDYGRLAAPSSRVNQHDHRESHRITVSSSSCSSRSKYPIGALTTSYLC